MKPSLSVFIIAGEPSGDRLGASLMDGLSHYYDAKFEGVGGPMMSENGLDSIFQMDELSIMGLVEVLPKLSKLLKRISETARAVIASGADVLITIDSPDFCLRVASKVKAINPNFKVVHYVAPSVWAWRPGRAGKMAAYVDHVLALLPFEPPYMEAAGMSCDFVGHPVVDDIQATKTDIDDFKSKFNISPNAKMLTVLPGSRGGEVQRLSPIFLDVIQKLRKTYPDLVVIIPAVGKRVEQLQQVFSDHNVTILDPRKLSTEDAEHQKRTCFAACDAALAASGTVSLELAAAGTPMVIAYKMQWLTAMILKRRLQISTVTLVNLITDTLTVREFLIEDCTANKITPAVLELLQNAEIAATHRAINNKAIDLLGRGHPEGRYRAAKSVKTFLEKNKAPETRSDA